VRGDAQPFDHLAQRHGDWMSLAMAFAASDHEAYTTAFLQAISQKEPPDPTYVLLYLISLDRLGRQTELARSYVDSIEAAQDKWLDILARLALGRVTLEDVLAVADTQHKKAMAYYYAACQQVTEGNLKKARRLFKSGLKGSLTSSQICIETFLTFAEFSQRGWQVPAP
jgi:hypothetical protein